MLQRITLLATLLIVTACQSQSAETLKQHLPGSYKLHIGTAYGHSRQDFSESRLSINSDGTYQQSCLYKGSEPPHHAVGKWTVTNTNVHFNYFLDCAGVYGGLIVEDSEKPLILLDPDVNIFYTQ